MNTFKIIMCSWSKKMTSYAYLCGTKPELMIWKKINPNNISSEDTIIFYDRKIKTHEKIKCKKKIAFLVEPHELGKNHSYVLQHYKEFKVVITNYKRYLKIDSRFQFLRPSYSLIHVNDMKVYNKTELCSTFITKKKQTIGHKLRHILLKNYNNKKINIKIDWFGRDNTLIKKDNVYSQSVLKKLEGLKNYYFQVVIENIKEAGHTTEKLIDCFVTGTIPIYWGSSLTDLEGEFDTKGILYVSNIDEIINILNNLNIDIYHNKLEAVRNNFNIVTKKKMFMVDDTLYKTILSKLD